ncbi:protein of unknown function [Rhizobiales bacterium GAS113]|nr:protein of unknown function [Rhizobiales bacterium GAS113]
MASQHRADVYDRITAEIVAAIEAGAGDYSMPWHHDGAATARPVNVASGKAYRGVNVLALRVAAHGTGYPTGLWEANPLLRPPDHAGDGAFCFRRASAASRAARRSSAARAR